MQIALGAMVWVRALRQPFSNRTHYPCINNLLAVPIALCDLQWIATDGGLDGSLGYPADADEQPLLPVELEGQSNEEYHEDSSRQATEHCHYSLACTGGGRRR